MIRPVNNNILIRDVDVKHKGKIYIPEGVDIGKSQVAKGLVISFPKEEADDIFAECDTSKDIFVYYNKFCSLTPFEIDGKLHKVIESRHIICVEN